jgi:16S rRNA processing protein RimM
MIKSDCRYIGTLAKLHSFKGRFVLISDGEINKEIENWESILLEIDGLLVPFFIDSMKITSDSSAIIGFEGINDPEQARELISCKVYQLSAVAIHAEKDFVQDDLAGYTIIDQKLGSIGEIDQILDYNQNLLFRILKGNREILIPVSEEIIVKVNHKKKEIIMDVPDGLLDL